MHNYPLFYYPTSIASVDDNESFLASLKMGLENFPFHRTFKNPIEAIDYLKDNQQASSSIDHFIKATEPGEEKHIDHHEIRIHFTQIHQKIYDPDRFKRISVVILDYAMPRMNGIELSRKLRSMGIKIIMLTGQADEQLAVQAFNEGLIDRFILKSTENLIQKLNTTILELQIKYFLEKIHIISKCFPPELSLALMQPHNPFFRHLIEKLNIIEYYPINTQSNFILLDKHGETFWLFVKSTSELKEYHELACDGIACDNISQSIMQHDKMPCFYSDEAFRKAPNQWESLMYPITQIKNQPKLYYALIPANQFYYPLSNIYSYEDFSFKHHETFCIL